MVEKSPSSFFGNNIVTESMASLTDGRQHGPGGEAARHQPALPATGPGRRRLTPPECAMCNEMKHIAHLSNIFSIAFL